MSPQMAGHHFFDGIAVASFCKDKNLDQEDPWLRKGGSSAGREWCCFFPGERQFLGFCYMLRQMLRNTYLG